MGEGRRYRRAKGASRGAENFKRGWLDVDVTVATADPPGKVPTQPSSIIHDTGLAMTVSGSTIPVAAYTVLGPAISHHHLDFTS